VANHRAEWPLRQPYANVWNLTIGLRSLYRPGPYFYFQLKDRRTEILTLIWRWTRAIFVSSNHKRGFFLQLATTELLLATIPRTTGPPPRGVELSLLEMRVLAPIIAMLALPMAALAKAADPTECEGKLRHRHWPPLVRRRRGPPALVLVRAPPPRLNLSHVPPRVRGSRNPAASAGHLAFAAACNIAAATAATATAAAVMPPLAPCATVIANAEATFVTDRPRPS